MKQIIFLLFVLMISYDGFGQNSMNKFQEKENELIILELEIINNLNIINGYNEAVDDKDYLQNLINKLDIVNDLQYYMIILHLYSAQTNEKNELSEIITKSVRNSIIDKIDVRIKRINEFYLKKLGYKPNFNIMQYEKKILSLLLNIKELIQQTPIEQCFFEKDMIQKILNSQE